MRSKRMLALAGLGAGSLLSFMAACGSVNEPFVIVVGGVDAGADDGATTDASSDDAATDATVQDSGPDGSVQDASVDATVTDAGADAAADARQDSAIVDAGPVLADGSSVVTVGDAQVIIPPLDPTLLGDGGIVVSDGGLALADGGALTPRQFRDLVNGITCERISDCCCPGCSAVDLATPGAGFSASKCTTAFGANGFQLSLFGNETIPSNHLVLDATKLAPCLSLVNAAISSCQSISATNTSAMRSLCLQAFTSTNPEGASCVGPADCEAGLSCRNGDAGTKICQPVLGVGAACNSLSDCCYRGVSGSPPNFCQSTDAGKACAPFLSVDMVCTSNFDCGGGACTTRSNGTKQCSTVLPFATQGDPLSYCAAFTP